MKKTKKMRNSILCAGIIGIVLCSLGCVGGEQESPETVPSSTTSPPTTPPTTSPSSNSSSPPTAKFSMHPEDPRDTDRIMFHNESTDPDEEPLRFEWYIDGNFDCACMSISEKFSAGDHTVKLVAMDGQGNEDVYEVTFHVSETFIATDPAELVLRRENVGLVWTLVKEESVEDHGYRTIFELGEKRVTCTVESYDTVEAAQHAFDDTAEGEFLPHQSLGNKAIYKKTENSVDVVFRYGNLICSISMNTSDFNETMSYCRSLESKLNQVR